jgi:hypothetical protein
LDGKSAQNNTLSSKGDDDDDDDDDDDPLDCSSLIVPQTYELAEQVAKDAVEKWRQLDQRRIISLTQEEDEEEEDGSSAAETPRKKRRAGETQTIPRWYEKNVRLPEKFDYATRESQPPEDDGTGDRVVSLDDPTQTLSYHRELWKLFESIPTAEQLEEQAIAGCDMPETERVYKEIAEGYPSVDGHALSRLRLSARHDDAPSPLSALPRKGRPLVSTIRFECLRQQVKRGSMPDTNRMVVEFLGSQTLLDFHKVLVESSDDVLWTESSDDTSDEVSSGFFFIEGTFYTTGAVDYTSVIQEWWKGGTENLRKSRAAHMGLEVTDELPVSSMNDMRLEDLPCRLGVRYVHVHHGDVECAVFATDRRLVPQEYKGYPILHDVWSPSYTPPDCEACRTRPATIATSTTCELTDGQHRTLCEACCRQLKLPSTEIRRYSVWRGQSELSAGASRSFAF